MKQKNYIPPKLGQRLLKRFLRDDLAEEVLGDLEEKFYAVAESKSLFRAKLNYWYQVINYLRPFAVKISRSKHSNNYAMFQHYFKISWRNLLRNKSFSFINITGLALGLATCLVIMLFVVDELSYDRYNEKADRIVRVVLKGNLNGEEIKEASTPAPVAPTFVEEFPEVLQGSRLRRFGTPKITYKNNTYRSSSMAFVDPNFFEVFTLPFLQGDPKTALLEPNSIVITQEQAEKYFGDEEPLNKILDFRESGEQYKVTGVMEKVPRNSHFHFDLFASMAGLEDAKVNNWMSSNYFNYLVLSEGTDPHDFEKKLPDLVEKYIGAQFDQIGMLFQEFKAGGNEVGLYVQPLTDIHLYSNFDNQSELEPGGDIKTVYIFAAVALLMLLIACINFMNLTTAGATKRLKEVGVKKVLGSQKSQLIYQFLTESFISTVIAIFLAVLIAVLALPMFEHLSGKELEVGFLWSPKVLLTLTLLVLLINVLAGSYPAFFLSSFKPISALRNKIANGGRSKGIRSSLVVFQFVISVGLILATIIVDQQMSFIQNKNIGYDREQLLVLRESYLLGNNEEAFKNQLLSDPRIESVTMSAFIPAGPTDNNMSGIYPGQEKEAIRRTIIYNVDEQYIPTMGMELVEGRNFSQVFGDEANHVIINETGVKTFGFEGSPIGQTLTMNTDNEGGKKSLTVIGVVKDFHFRSLHEAIAPLIMLNNPYGGLIARVKTKDISELLSSIEAKWETFNAEEPFTYAFLDELYNETYVAEQKMGNILKIFALLTIFVACLGLFGLVTFTAEQRVKEIGVRKVLGANVTQIVGLLSKDFLKLVVISIILASPIAYYLMKEWLQNFAYRIDIKWWMFIVAGVAAVLIAVFTVSFQAIKAAMRNPVDSLRSE